MWFYDPPGEADFGCLLKFPNMVLLPIKRLNTFVTLLVANLLTLCVAYLCVLYITSQDIKPPAL